MESISLHRLTIALFSQSLPALPSPLIAIKHSSSGIASIHLSLWITYQSLWSLSFVPPPPPPLLIPPLVLMHLTDALASNLLIWAQAQCFVSIQM